MDIFFLVFATFSLFVSRYITPTGALSIGLNYGTKGDNLPSPAQGFAKLQERHVHRVRLFEPDHDILAYVNSNPAFEIMLGTLNKDTKKLASDPTYAATWVNTNIVAYPNITFSYITVGNEIAIPSDLASALPQAMTNLDAAIKSTGRKIPVSTAITYAITGVSYPPSAGAFTDDSASVMGSIAAFLETNQYPLCANIYPYFAYSDNPADVRFDYAMFNTSDVVVQDGDLQYKNLCGPNVKIVVSETGWPSAGNGDIATVKNAEMYINNLMGTLFINEGSPKRPRHNLETYIFAMYNENLKPDETECNFGVYRPDLTEVYHVNFPDKPEIPRHAGNGGYVVNLAMLLGFGLMSLMFL
ncbi:hypothetical protein MKW94_008334 [Papaver nudicaule]|uniref:Glucan endo-1,3-beta-D-glucosidase n=1 Tax=Papaver nudicaule TaxID=74823 RepID=A0AA41SEX0_PAPNU|nr:hypothetical protein [Papaver nudicaule]